MSWKVLGMANNDGLLCLNVGLLWSVAATWKTSVLFEHLGCH